MLTLPIFSLDLLKTVFVANWYTLFVFVVFPFTLSIIASAISVIKLLIFHKRNIQEFNKKYKILEIKALRVLNIIESSNDDNSKLGNESSSEIKTIQGYSRGEEVEGIKGKYVACREYFDNISEYDEYKLSNDIENNINKDNYQTTEKITDKHRNEYEDNNEGNTVVNNNEIEINTDPIVDTTKSSKVVNETMCDSSVNEDSIVDEIKKSSTVDTIIRYTNTKNNNQKMINKNSIIEENTGNEIKSNLSELQDNKRLSIKKTISNNNSMNKDIEFDNNNDCINSSDYSNHITSCIRKRMLNYAHHIKHEITLNKVKFSENKSTKVAVNITPPKSYSKCIKKKWIHKEWMLPMNNNQQEITDFKEDNINNDTQIANQSIDMKHIANLKKEQVNCLNPRWIDTIDEEGKVIHDNIQSDYTIHDQTSDRIQNRSSLIGYQRLIEGMKERRRITA